MFALTNVIEWIDLHVTEQRHHFQVFKDSVDAIQAKFFLLIELVDVAHLRVHEEETKAHNFDQHMLLFGSQKHFLIKHVNGKVDNFTNEVFEAGNLFQSVFDRVTNLVLGGEEH